MRKSDLKPTILIAILLITTFVYANVTVEEGTVFDPSNSNAQYYTANETNFSQVTVYSDRVNFSYTNVSTQASQSVNVSIWSHNFSKSSGEVAHYFYNTSADTKFHKLDTSKDYKVFFNSSEERTITDQEYLNVSVPGDTNLTVKKADSFNSAPDAPTTPSPSDGSDNIDYSPTLTVDASDPDGNNMDVRFWDGNGNLIGSDTGVSDGGTAAVEWTGLNSGTTYNWKAEADDGELSTNSSTWSFTTNYDVELVSDSQFFDNTSVNHEYKVTSYSNDTDGESDISSCKVYYEDSNANSGLLDGTIYNDNNGDNQVKCSRNISNSISEVEVGETVSTSVRFHDGESWANTSLDSNTVPNNAPTAPTSFTDLGQQLTNHTPSIQWSGEDDSDGDSMYITAYTGQGSTPTTNDTSSDASSSSTNIGQSVNLEDGNTYYYRLKVCDEYGACSSFTSSDDFSMNEEPKIESYSINNSNPSINDSIQIEANISDDNLDSVNFTVLEDGNILYDGVNGSLNSGIWVSPEFKTDERVYYNYTVEPIDSAGENSLAQGSFSIGYENEGEYTRTFSTTENVSEVKAEVYGDRNGGGINLEANTSTSGSSQIENGTWYNIGSGKDLTFALTLTGDGASTPKVDSYKLKYKTSYKNSGEYLSTAQSLESSSISGLTIDEEEPENTDASYEVRVGNTTTPDTSWSSWKQCSNSCDLSFNSSDYFQFKTNLQGTDYKTPEVKSITVDH